MIDKFFTIKELKDTGLEMFGSYIFADVKIGTQYLKPEVISMWDFSDYSKFYTYFDDGIKLVVNLCIKTSETTTECEHLTIKKLKELNKNI